MMFILGSGVVLIALIALAHGGPECESLGGDCATDGGWDPMAKLDEIGTGNYDKAASSIGTNWPQKSREVRWNQPVSAFENETANETEAATVQNVVTPSASKTEEQKEPLSRSSQFQEWLVPFDAITDQDLLLDISENASEHIPGSVYLPYPEFMLDGNLKSVEEVVLILGDAGVSENDSVLIYGECLPCGGGPSAATYVYWMMKSLGHENVRVLDGTVEDWKEAGNAATSESMVLPGTVYTPHITMQYIGSYEFIKEGNPQIIDARSMQDFGINSIPGAINIPYESVLDEKKLKDEATLRRIFAVISKDRPVVVYTNTGIKASVEWFVLELLGYDAKLYSWQDWLYNQQPEGNLSG
ncbi:MAG: sulfurtransferase [Methanotrichaceae archaeon]|nr:sulfurtransferase [Methanotrichaceae archaeon]